MRRRIELLRKELYKGEPEYEQNPKLHRELDGLLSRYDRLRSQTDGSS